MDRLLKSLVNVLGLDETAKRIGYTRRTIRRWQLHGVSNRGKAKVKVVVKRRRAAIKARKAKEKPKKPPTYGKRPPREPIPPRKERKPPPPLPAPFKPIVTEASVEMAIIIQNIVACIEQALPELMTTSSHAINSDKSTDGEVVLTGIPRAEKDGASQQFVDMFNELGECVRKAGGIPSDYWVSFLIRFPMAHDDEDERYEHYQGLNQIGLYWRHFVNMDDALMGIKDVSRFVMEAGWRKPTHVILRLHWNPMNTKPEGRS